MVGLASRSACTVVGLRRCWSSLSLARGIDQQLKRSTNQQQRLLTRESVSVVGLASRLAWQRPTTAEDFHGDFALIRYNSDGTPDSSFGMGGIAMTDFDNSYDAASSVAIDSAGRIFVGGTSDNNFALACYISVLNVGLPEITSLDHSINIYPNPGNGIFQIGPTVSPIQTAAVYNLTGRSVFFAANFKPQTSNTIDLSQQPEGIYFLHLGMKEGIAVKKIVISH